MATLAQIQTFALGNPEFKQRFQASRLQIGWNILAENPGTAPRKAWAVKVFTDPFADLTKEYNWFLSHALVQAAGAAITDANMNIATASFVDAWSA